MYTGFESMAMLVLVNNDKESNGNKRVEFCRHCGKSFVTDDSREFCSYDCQKSA